jgi:hypothetical protein
MAPMPPAFAEAAKRNMEMWQRVQENFFKPGGLFNPAGSPEPKE